MPYVPPEKRTYHNYQGMMNGSVPLSSFDAEHYYDMADPYIEKYGTTELIVYSILTVIGSIALLAFALGYVYYAIFG